MVVLQKKMVQKIFLMQKRRSRQWLFCGKEEAENGCSVEERRKNMVTIVAMVAIPTEN